MSTAKLPAGWKSREAEWAAMGPGVRWKIRPATGADLGAAQAETGRIISSMYQGRGGLERVRLPEGIIGDASDLEHVAGLGVLISAILLAEVLVEAWEGMDDAETGVPLELGPEMLTDALFLGPRRGGPPMFQAFMAWVDRPSMPIAAELRRLRVLAK